MGTVSPSVLSKQSRIAKIAQHIKDKPLHSISCHMDLFLLEEAYRQTNKRGAAGVDGQTAAQYEENLLENLKKVLKEFKDLKYFAPPVKRVEIPKGKDQTRPIGIPTFEDKVLQRAVVMLLEPIYELEFYNFSYGFRPRKSPKDAVKNISIYLHKTGGGYVLDVDIRGFFDNLDHGHIQKMLRKRVNDKVINWNVGKWLNAGVMQDGVFRRSEKGTPQGGVISPLLANIYLHEVIDKWWVQNVLPYLKERYIGINAAIFRYADDVVMVFNNKEAALQTKQTLIKRLAKFGLELHPDKTKLLDMRLDKGDNHTDKGPKTRTFDFLGFTFYWGKTRIGKNVIKKKTSKKSLSKALRNIRDKLRSWMHLSIPEQSRGLNHILLGFDNYFGVMVNYVSLKNLRYQATRIWKKSLSRRSQRYLNWKKFKMILRKHPLPKPQLEVSTRYRQLTLKFS